MPIKNKLEHKCRLIGEVDDFERSPCPGYVGSVGSLNSFGFENVIICQIEGYNTPFSLPNLKVSGTKCVPISLVPLKETVSNQSIPKCEYMLLKQEDYQNIIIIVPIKIKRSNKSSVSTTIIRITTTFIELDPLVFYHTFKYIVLHV